MQVAERMNDATTQRVKRSRPTSIKPRTVRQNASSIGTILFFSAVALVLYQGWQVRDIAYLTAESGIGYWLGIAGGVMMLVLLLYPLRKRVKALRLLGPIKQLFRMHMVLGVLGPTLILFHCNFQLGALNSNVALICMSVVAASGLLGRYFYVHIHHGLYGSQATVRELLQESSWQLEQLVDELHYIPQLQERLKAYEKSALTAGHGWLSFITIPWLSVTSKLAYITLWRQCRQAIQDEVTNAQLRKQQLRKTRKNLIAYFRATRRVAAFTFYTRLFSSWHILHLPLFVMMMITGIIHVIAVHMY